MQLSNPPTRLSFKKRAAALLVVVLALAAAGCGNIAKRQVTVPQLLTPLVEADTSRLVAEINRRAEVSSIGGKIDIQFLDTSFAECGVADRYRTADGTLRVQRPGQIYLLIEAPLVSLKIAELSSNGERFWAALYQGDEKYRRFVYGTNAASYEKLEDPGEGPRCDGDGRRQREAMQRATVSALSSLRPQHFTDALLVPTVSPEGSNLIYSQTETFEEEPDTRPRARSNSRVVRGYYIMTELEPAGENRARVLRRFWFNRVGELSLSRVQTYNERGQLVTDVTYRNPQPFGSAGNFRLPGTVEITRPQDRYALRVTFQDPAAVRINQQFDPEIFALRNTSNLPAVDLDARR